MELGVALLLVVIFSLSVSIYVFIYLFIYYSWPEFLNFTIKFVIAISGNIFQWSDKKINKTRFFEKEKKKCTLKFWTKHSGA